MRQVPADEDDGKDNSAMAAPAGWSPPNAARLRWPGWGGGRSGRV